MKASVMLGGAQEISDMAGSPLLRLRLALQDVLELLGDEEQPRNSAGCGEMHVRADSAHGARPGSSNGWAVGPVACRSGASGPGSAGDVRFAPIF